MTDFIAAHGVWLVAAFIALETVGAPLPAEAFLIAAAIFAASTHDFHIGSLIMAGAQHSRVATILGFVAVVCATSNIVGGFLITDRMLRMFKSGSGKAVEKAGTP